VAFLDLKLPGTDGVQIFESIRQLQPDIPVVVITGYPRDSLVEAAMNLGAFACLVKPFSMGEVLGLLEALGLRAAA
jgi:CheY-like chemotaxis protein